MEELDSVLYGIHSVQFFFNLEALFENESFIHSNSFAVVPIAGQLPVRKHKGRNH